MTPTHSSTRMAAWLESAWLARYLDRALASDEAAWFESYLLDKPDLLGMVEAEADLRDALAAERSAVLATRDGGGVEAVARDEASESSHLTQPLPAKQTSANRPQSTRHARAWLPLAACLLLGLGGGWLGQRALVSKPDMAPVIANPTRIVFDTMRGVPDTSTTGVGADSSGYVLVEVALPPGAARVQLQTSAHSPYELIPAADGFVSFLIARSALTQSMQPTLSYQIDGKAVERAIQLEPQRKGNPQ